MESSANSFAHLTVGDSAIVLTYRDAPPAYQRKLLGLGLTPGTPFSVVKAAPLGDPVEIEVRGFRLTLRRREAACLEVTKL